MSRVQLGCFVALLLLACLPSLCFIGVDAADIDSMKDFLAGLRNIASIYPEWNVANITNYCGWQGITCNAAGDVTVIHLRTNDGVPNIIGKLSPSIANFRSLEKVDFAKQYIVGDLPAEIFLLPNITDIIVTDTALNIHFPTEPASRTIKLLWASGTNASVALPDIFAWDRLERLSFGRASLRCPIPAGLIPFMLNGNIKCRLHGNEMPIIDGKYCGQVAVDDCKCTMAGRIEAPQVFERGSPDPDVTHRIVKGGLQIEIAQDRISFFATKTLNGKVYPYRAEYFQLISNNWEVHSSDLLYRNLVMGPFKPQLVWVGEDEFRVNTTLGRDGEFEVEWVFRFVPVADSNVEINGMGIKFSIIGHNLKYLWPDPVQFPYMGVPITIIYRLPHSTETSMIRCGAVFQYCKSDVADLRLTIPLTAPSDSNTIRTTMSNPRMELSFTYAIVGALDGVNFTVDNTDFEIDRFFVPIAGHDYMAAVDAYNSSLVLPSGSPDKQFFAFILELRVPHFNNVMVYDPDINLALLFDPPIDEIKEVMAAGVISAIVIVVVVVVGAASITAVKFVIWPRISRVPTPPKDFLEDSEPQKQPRQTIDAKWRPVTADDARLTNL